jgi:hypothetical protein
MILVVLVRPALVKAVAFAFWRDQAIKPFSGGFVSDIMDLERG